MKFRRFLPLLVTVALLMGCLPTASASSVLYADNPGFIMMPRTTDIRKDKFFSGNGDESWTDFFDVPSAEPNYRIWVQNTGDHPVTVKVTLTNYTGTVQCAFTVAAKDQGYRDVLSSGSGRRYITINSTAGNPFSGRVRVRTASDYTEF